MELHGLDGAQMLHVPSSLKPQQVISHLCEEGRGHRAAWITHSYIGGENGDAIFVISW